MKKDAVLDTHLKDVYVKSYDPIQIDEKIVETSDRSLPLNKRSIEFQEFGHLEPGIVPPGRITLRQVLKLLSTYQINPKSWDVDKEALNCNISRESIGILGPVPYYPPQQSKINMKK